MKNISLFPSWRSLLAAIGGLVVWTLGAGAQTLTVTPSATNYTTTAGSISYDVTITYPAATAALGLRVVTPSDWTYAATTGANVPTCLDAVGAKPSSVTGEGFGWFYFTAPTSPASFTLKFNYPANQTGDKTVAFSVISYGATGTAKVTTPTPALPDLLAPPTAPTIVTQPNNATVLTGTAVSFTVAASGSSPMTYQWSKDGKAITGATNATYAIAATAVSDAGKYTAVVTNARGSATSNAATLIVSGAPTITAQPAAVTVAPGANATLSVKVTSTITPTYQWYFNSSPIAGATNATLTITSVTGAATGYYSVVIGNSVGASVTSSSVLLQVAPTGTAATQKFNAPSSRGYLPSGTITITNTLSFPSTATALGWSVQIPTGFALVSETSGASSVPPTGATTKLDWAWDAGAVKSPISFTYTLVASDTATGTQTVDAFAFVRLSGDTLPIIATPDPLSIPVAGKVHSADTSGDWTISVDELAAVVALFNTANSNVRTGAYKYDSATSVYVPDPATAAGSVVPDPLHIHSADTNADGMIDLKELMQLIELYNYRADSTRTGAYHWETSETGTGVDHYAPGA